MRYLALPLTRSITYYVLPAPPWTGSPGVPPPLVPAESALWKSCYRWFHVVPARDLRRHFGGATTMQIRTSSLSSVAGSRTLGAFVDDLIACKVGRRYDGRTTGGIDPPAPEGREDYVTETDASVAEVKTALMTPLVAFVPASDIPGFYPEKALAGV
jgi:hypothetical protein